MWQQPTTAGGRPAPSSSFLALPAADAKNDAVAEPLPFPLRLDEVVVACEDEVVTVASGPLLLLLLVVVLPALLWRISEDMRRVGDIEEAGCCC
jgi:hypothetical protein